MKSVFIFFLCFALATALVSCNTVSADVPVQVIADRVGSQLEEYPQLSAASDDYIRYCMKSDLSLYEEHLLLCPYAGNNYTELGIFKLTADADRDAACAELKRYLAFKEENWDMRYRADDFVRVAHARVLVHGRYCFFAIVSDKARSAVEHAFTDALR